MLDAFTGLQTIDPIRGRAWDGTCAAIAPDLAPRIWIVVDQCDRSSGFAKRDGRRDPGRTGTDNDRIKCVSPLMHPSQPRRPLRATPCTISRLLRRSLSADTRSRF